MSQTADDSATFARREVRGEGWALVIAWSREEPERVGELAWVAPDDSEVHWLGRGDERWTWWRQRPGHNEARPPLGGAKLSREHLRVERVDAGLSVENVGRRPMLVRGRETKQVVLHAGDALTIEGVLVLVCVERPEVLAPLRYAEVGAFGGPDAHGVVGESPATWALRESIALGQRVGGALRHDFEIPSLGARREDVPFLAEQLLREAVAAAGLDGELRLGPKVIEAALRKSDTRALEASVWHALRDARDGWADLVDDEDEPELEPDAEPEIDVGVKVEVPPSVRDGLATLTKAERTVLGFVAQNKTSVEIAKALFVSVRTVQNHRARICDKLGLRGHNRLLAVAMALDPKDYQ